MPTSTVGFAAEPGEGKRREVCDIATASSSHSQKLSFAVHLHSVEKYILCHPNVEIEFHSRLYHWITLKHMRVIVIV
jgi:hypothetical protein